MVIFENIDTDTELSRDFWINIKKEILENINIDKEILQNIDIDKILYGFRIWHIKQGLVIMLSWSAVFLTFNFKLECNLCIALHIFTFLPVFAPTNLGHTVDPELQVVPKWQLPEGQESGKSIQ